ncbi:ribonuclease PH [Kallotenue papyrolyticum]|uniref:ribonuclease PH n=1 Tax=Kallotenue papyrolyticum TaxID=1325125 RepID=UPI000478620C|nr:ribonuclease PH [Kallotenue papyrolyticum]
MPRSDGRAADQLRPIEIIVDYQRYAEGSALIRYGNTHVLCSATVEAGVPAWLRGQAEPQGWLTAEYALLPRATLTRTRRERNGLGGRTQEIQRLIGRSLRAALDLSLLGERTITIDCDVLQADGGTRTAAITGGYVALARAIQRLLARGELATSPLVTPIAAVSVGIVKGEALLDLDYSEDSIADVDANLVQTGDGRLVELQATAEGSAFDRAQLDLLLRLGEHGIRQLLELQQMVLAAAPPL